MQEINTLNEQYRTALEALKTTLESEERNARLYVRKEKGLLKKKFRRSGKNDKGKKSKSSAEKDGQGSSEKVEQNKEET